LLRADPSLSSSLNDDLAIPATRGERSSLEWRQPIPDLAVPQQAGGHPGAIPEKSTMNYAEVLAALDEASLFQLYRLNAAIGNQLDDPLALPGVRSRVDP
jgi:hypothetical protein